MRIATQAALAAISTLAAVALVAAGFAWARTAEQAAARDRETAEEIIRGVMQLRMATFEYGAQRIARARSQWLLVSARVDRAIAEGRFQDAEAQALLEDLKRRRAAARRIFAQLAAESRPGEEAHDALRSQLLNRLLIGQQDSLADAGRLAELAQERIASANRRAAAVALAGLGFIAAVIVAGHWLFRRRVLAPIERLGQATREVAAGRWTGEAYAARDEVGDLWRHFDAMVQALRAHLERIERGNAALAAANRELEAFAYSVSHDLRAPLRSLDGFSAVLLEDHAGQLDAEGRDALGRIRAASRRMGALIDDLLRLSQVTRAPIRCLDVDLSALASRLCASLAEEHPRRRVRCSIAAGLAARGDPELIEIALLNLLQNAWKFTARREDAAIEVGRRGEGGRGELFVADNGVGFDMAHAAQLFAPFQRLHAVNEFPGTGIGLAIVQRIVQRHGGAIRAEARPGEGATFLFTLGA